MQLLRNQQGISGMTIGIIIGLVVIGVGAMIYAANNGNSDDANSTNEAAMEDTNADAMEKDLNTNNDAMEKEDGDAMEEDAMEKKTNTNGDAMMEDDGHADEKDPESQPVSSGPGEYKTYSQAAYASASNEKRVLFFHATWCPTCKAANAAFTSRPDDIPSGVVILKTDYDTETALKQKYGITYQHTFVQVDAEGNELAKWNGGDIDLLVSKLQ